MSLSRMLIQGVPWIPVTQSQRRDPSVFGGWGSLVRLREEELYGHASHGMAEDSATGPRGRRVS